MELDRVRLQSSENTPVAARDQNNTMGARVERGIPSTQLGPEGNSRKW